MERDLINYLLNTKMIQEKDLKPEKHWGGWWIKYLSNSKDISNYFATITYTKTSISNKHPLIYTP